MAAWSILKQKPLYLITTVIGICCLLQLRYGVPSDTTTINVAIENMITTSYNSSNVFITSKQNTSDDIHIAMIFDHNRVDHVIQVIRSISYCSKRNIVYHLVKPPSLNVVTNESVVLYDASICVQLVGPVLAFSNPDIHLLTHCKLYLASVLPPSIKQVLYVDHDITAIQHITPCYFGNIEFDSSQLIAMGPDMGDICQRSPDKCRPMAYQWTLSNGTKEPYQFNGGVMLMDLNKMRTWNFVRKLTENVIRTARLVNFKKARWGEQDFINSFFRLHPEILKSLPCGCNYQYSAINQHIKCPNGQPVYLAHGWGRGTSKPTNNPYNRLFYYFKQHVLSTIPPTVPFVSGNESLPLVEEVSYEWDFNCSYQSYKCSDKNKFEYGRTFYDNTVFVLTRTAKRRSLFIDNMMSVRDQTHPLMRHLVVTNDLESTEYLKELNVNFTLVPDLYNIFDPTEPCTKCGASKEKHCANAPSMNTVDKRKAFLNCYCNTSYPMNKYMNNLHNEIVSNNLSGWIVYLDDDNLIADRYSISDALAHATNTSQLLMWRSHLQRVTPSNQNWERIIMGDVDASGFMFHSSHIQYTKWENKRCSDYWTLASLSAHCIPIWINNEYVIAHPLRVSGLGMRGDINNKLTVVITTYNSNGLRPLWVRDIIATYSSEEMSSVVHKVILVWNNPTTNVSNYFNNSNVVILSMAKNSLNNRWIETLRHIETDAVLNLDDDLMIDKSALICMMSYWQEHPDRLVGPFVRTTKHNKYLVDELLHGEHYSMVLPRAMILHRQYLQLYSRMNISILQYVDEQDAHCDDIALAFAVYNDTRKPSLRISLPPKSVLDFF